MAVHPDPDEFERDLDAILADPAFQEKLDRLSQEREEGRAVYHSHEEVRRRVGLGPNGTLSEPSA